MNHPIPTRYECLPLEGMAYPHCGIRPPELFQYPEPKFPIRLVLLGWNPPKPYGGFWSLTYEDNLRHHLHSILKELGQIQAPAPDDQNFLDEFLQNGYYFIHTVKCWTEPKFPGFGRDAQSREGRRRKSQVGLPLLYSCVRTHLAEELRTLGPQNVCALGKLPFLALCELYPSLKTASATPTQGSVFPANFCGLPWPLLYTCFPQRRSVPMKGMKQREKALEIVGDHLRTFLRL